MASSLPRFPDGAFFSAAFSHSLSRMLQQPWRALGVTVPVAVGISLAAATARLPAVAAEKRAKLNGAVIDFFQELSSAPPRPLFSSASFASLAVALSDYETEPKTGIEFPGESFGSKLLTGIGLRTKTILGLKSITVYAYGVYTDLDSLKSNVGLKYSSDTLLDTADKEAMFDNITAADVGLTVRLVIVYPKLKIGTIRGAFEESIGIGVKKFSGKEDKELVGRFTSLFTDDLELPKGTTIDITRLPGQVLQASVNGQDIGSVESPLLCRALFDLYIGENAFDKAAREKMSLTFSSQLADGVF